MLSTYIFLLFIGVISGSHYRGGTVSYTIRPISVNLTNNGQKLPVRINQRHSWRRSAHFCNDTSLNQGNIIGEGTLSVASNTSTLLQFFPTINASVRCTDYNQEFDYSTGENSTTVLLPANNLIEYAYRGCCWIPLLPPDSGSNWSLKLVINTNPRSDGTLNNSPKAAMNPIVEVELNKIHTIRIPMADSDGDTVRCRWGKSELECGSICTPKGILRSDPCELVYNASKVGYQAVALVIEDFDSNNNVISAIPLQFLIHIVNRTSTCNCTDPPIYIGEWPEDSCIGIESNTTVQARIQVRVPCKDSCSTLDNILTVSPAGLIKGNIFRDSSDTSLYTMPIEWTPQPDQYGVHQFCVTPVDSQRRTGSQVCLTFQVDVRPPEFVLMTPMGLVSENQSSWTLETDRDIIRPRRSSGVYIRFFKRATNEEVYRIDVASDLSVFYQSREISFFTTGHRWEQGEEYYILLDSGLAILNESCGVESAPMNNRSIWVFQVAVAPTTTTTLSTAPETTTAVTTEPYTSTALMMNSTPTSTIPSIRPACPRWLNFNTNSNESTSTDAPQFVFCFSVTTSLADVTISANTWVPCMTWKLSDAADPLIELYSKSTGELLAENDDGNNSAYQNCYAAVLSYRLPRGDYRVIIRNPKCSFGKFELRLSAEIDRNSK